ncbi:hypothetical protein BLJAPNOD_05382 [Ensifer sp. M14]|uniref:Alpha/beta hydrolase n=1 Tax=Sinorhizobium sp. M14 TaxID=430451 RepID=A0A142BP64_9HYPH|nr:MULTISPECIES: hypothetical protein [Sinorhizobium/Ensifer group]AMP34872.1 hypothetical protein pSinB_005 [Sinorhizobium sp. M14]RDL47661.1 hypothetical protein BLJAPNOD_05382 [Ensifer sp. M14]
MFKIILIHGINNHQRSAEEIGSEWQTALLEGMRQIRFTPSISDIRFQAAYYGDVLYEETEEWARQGSDGRVMGPEDEAVAPRIDQLYRALYERCGVTDAMIADFRRKEAETEHEVTPLARGIHKRSYKAIARAIEYVNPGKGQFLTGVFAKQAAAYLFKPGLKERIDKLVAKQVFETLNADDKIIIIAHSLGTLVAYDLLRSYSEIPVKTFVTLGSPLGAAMIMDRLGPPFICLPNVGAWVNGTDPKDFVALGPRLDGKNIGCDLIENHVDLDNGHEDAHGIAPYLRQAKIAGAIEKAIT